MGKKTRSVIDRAFSSAQRWLSSKGYYGFTEDMPEHVSYRCGWVAGYEAARKDLALTSCPQSEKP